MRDLNYELKELCRRNRDGSYATQYAREVILTMIANQLHEMGFRDMRSTSLKPKHVQALVERWKTESLSAGTIKNRMTVLRWWAEKIGKQNVVARDNEHYGIAKRQYVTNASQSRELTTGELAKVTDPYTRLSLRFQVVFGLRREESIKIQPAWADRGDRLALRDSWTKGGRDREIPIRTGEQRELLKQAKQLARGGSLIPKTMTYAGQLQRFKAQCMQAGIRKVHGHRHHYAQERYRELTGRACPAQGGSTSRHLTAEERMTDRQAREIITAELGHGREKVTAVSSREEYHDDAAFMKVYEKASPLIQCMMDLAQMNGSHKGMILRMTLADITDAVVWTTLNKQQQKGQKKPKKPKRKFHPWTDDMRDVVNRILELRARVRGGQKKVDDLDTAPLFLNRLGKAVGVSGFNSMWRRATRAAGFGQHEFHFHDIKAKSLSDSPNLADAQERGDHTDARTTKVIYRRKPAVVVPLPRVSRKRT